MIPWHRLFGLAMTDYFTDSAYRVELEKDLSIKQQLLDVLIIEGEPGAPLEDPPDGLENLSRYNLMTYKSFHQPLDGWALDELVGHYVNYRKQISPSLEALLPVEDFRLFAVCSRHPVKLEAETRLHKTNDGLYEARWGSRSICIIVLSEVARVERNAIWQMFSGMPEGAQYGASHYRWRQPDLSTVMGRLFDFYRVEGFAMTYTVEDYRRELREELKQECKQELKQELKQEILAELTPEELLKRLPPEELLKRLSPEELLKRLSPEERLKGLTREEIEAYLKKLLTPH